jgi:periplasmic divalent cation tolerance protein
MTGVIQVVTTTASQDEAQKIARVLVDLRLAACVQVFGPITSTYRWQGAIETSQEWMCVAKTRASHYSAVEKSIRQAHSYDVPEILAVEVVQGARGYLDWLSGELADLSGPEIV